MTDIRNKKIGINSLALRILGFISMVCGSVGYLKGYGYDGLEALGWFSFAIFAFLLSEGCVNTSDRVLYIRRFAIFTLIAEPCYDLYRYKTLFSLGHQSVMGTLFIGLLIILLLEYLRKRYENLMLDGIVMLALGAAAYWFTDLYNFDYGGCGIIMIIAFYVSGHVKYRKLLQTAVLFYIAFFISTGSIVYVTLGGLQYPVSGEAFALLALPVIWLYNERRGPNGMILRVALYAVYPAHLLALYVMRLAELL